MKIIINAPKDIPNKVPNDPPWGRNESPGITKAPQPIILPRAKDQTLARFNDFFKLVSLCNSISPISLLLI